MSDVEKLAEEYAGVKNEGMGPYGQIMYSADSYGALQYRHIKMEAFKAGYAALQARASRLEAENARLYELLEDWLEWRGTLSNELFMASKVVAYKTLDVIHTRKPAADAAEGDGDG